MSVDVIIPTSETNDEPRRDALRYVTGLYERVYPLWRVILGICPPGPWSKALAVADGLKRSDAEIIVVADGDVWSPTIGTAVCDGLRTNKWSQPHRWVRRLDEQATADTYNGVLGPGRWDGALLDRREYAGFLGGGIVALHRETYDDCPLDPRFEGWGHEDESWAAALRVLHGERWVTPAGRLWHLWHPPADRNGALGAERSVQLRDRYMEIQGRWDKDEMRRLVSEARQVH